MTITLALDTPAVMSLFPEGSEARVKLTNAVVAEATKRVFHKTAKVPDDLTAQFTQAAKTHVAAMEKAVSEALQSHQVKLMKDSQLGEFVAPTHWSKAAPVFVLSQDTKDTLSKEVRHQFANAYRAEIELQLPAMVTKYMDAEVFAPYIDKRIKAMLDTEVGKRVAQLLEIK